MHMHERTLGNPRFLLSPKGEIFKEKLTQPVRQLPTLYMVPSLLDELHFLTHVASQQGTEMGVTANHAELMQLQERLVELLQGQGGIQVLQGAAPLLLG